MKHFVLYFLFIASLIAAAPTAWATNSNVSSPDINAEEMQLGLRFGFNHDDNNADAYNQRIHFDYGVSDQFAMRLISRQEHKQGDSFEYKATGLELKYQLFEDETSGFDGTVRAAYRLSDGDKKPDIFSLHWLYNYKSDHWNFRHNTVFSHQIGSDSVDGIGLELRSQAITPAWKNHSLGIEMFNNFGRLNGLNGYDAQSHRVGPVLKGKITSHLSYQLGAQFGISGNAPDHGLKFFLSHSF